MDILVDLYSCDLENIRLKIQLIIKMRNLSENKIVKEDLVRIANSLGSLSDKFNGKSILITGGAGFLGKYIVLTLDYLNKNVLNEPCKILVIDNFITGTRGQLEEIDNLKIIERDISKPLKIDEDVDYIFHAASIAAPVSYNKYRLETIDAGFLGTKNMLEIAKEKKIISFLFFSSSEVYGDPDPKFVPISEDYFGNVSCIGPRSFYDEPKRIGETLCVTYADIYSLPVKIIRPFNIYGPGMKLDDGRGAINFVVSALRGNKIPVYGSGRNTRTWCYISDAISGFFKVLLSNHNREVFNVGSDEQEIEMRHLAQIIVGLVKNEDVEIHNIEGPNESYSEKSDPGRRCPDLTKIRTMIGYDPKVNLVQGLKRFIEWVDEAMKANDSLDGLQKNCRLCDDSNLKLIISLGKTPLANNLLSDNDLEKSEEMYPLDMVYCNNCHLCQLSYVVPPEKMFKNYFYITSTTETFKNHFESMAKKIIEDFELSDNSLVVDIGSNDGLLLKKFNEKGIRVVGVESAENICEIARANGIDTLCGFFDEKIVNNIINLKGKADVVTANNVFAHVNDIKTLTKGVKKLLKENGVFVIEVQYILDTIKDCTFDNIYHEHLSYFSVMTLAEFFRRQEMEIFKVEHVDTHGGSIRVSVQKKGEKYSIDKSVNDFLERERVFGLDKFECYKDFGERVRRIGEEAKDFVQKAKNEGKKMIGYGSPAKATTLLNFFKINRDYIDLIIEDNPLKQGKTMPGVRIPIKNRDSLNNANPDYIIILAWNFAEEIMRKNKEYSEKGTKFVVLTPELKII